MVFGYGNWAKYYSSKKRVVTIGQNPGSSTKESHLVTGVDIFERVLSMINSWEIKGAMPSNDETIFVKNIAHNYHNELSTHKYFVPLTSVLNSMNCCFNSTDRNINFAVHIVSGNGQR